MAIFQFSFFELLVVSQTSTKEVPNVQQGMENPLFYCTQTLT